MNWRFILGGILVWRYWREAFNAILHRIPEVKRLEANLKALREDLARQRDRADIFERQFNETRAELDYSRKLVTDWAFVMNGWSPLYNVAPMPVSKREEPEPVPVRRQAREVAAEADREFLKEMARMDGRFRQAE